MTARAPGQAPAFELLSQPARQRLRARVADANGDIEAVAREIRQQLDHHDKASVDPASAQGQRHAERAFMLAQLTYLDHLQKETQPSNVHERPGLFARMKAAFTGSRAGG